MCNVILWGASGGIGRALAQKLAADGYTIAAISRHPGQTSAFTPYNIAILDVANPAQVRAAANQAAAITNAFDLFIYAAGDITSQNVVQMTPETWKRILDANLTGAFLTAQASLPLLSPEARLVFIGAVHERLRLPGLSAYAAAKAGLEAFAESLRKEARRKVLVVRPGAVNTPFWGKVPFSMPKNALSPAALADQILAAVAEGQSGNLDIG